MVTGDDYRQLDEDICNYFCHVSSKTFESLSADDCLDTAIREWLSTDLNESDKLTKFKMFLDIAASGGKYVKIEKLRDTLIAKTTAWFKNAEFSKYKLSANPTSSKSSNYNPTVSNPSQPASASKPQPPALPSSQSTAASKLGVLCAELQRSYIHREEWRDKLKQLGYKVSWLRYQKEWDGSLMFFADESPWILAVAENNAGAYVIPACNFDMPSIDHEAVKHWFSASVSGSSIRTITPASAQRSGITIILKGKGKIT